MPRNARIDLEGYWYHIIIRGQRKEDIFLDNEDFIMYLYLLDKVSKKYNIKIAAYCLMTNHIHLLIYRDKVSLGTIFREVHTKYAKYFNDKYNKVGYVFQGRFISKIILNERYLAALIKYIHNNPVEANIVDLPERYRWSSANFYKYGISYDILTLNRIISLDEYFEIEKNEIVGNENIKEKYIGTKEEFNKLDKRKRKNDFYFKKRRNVISIKDRVNDLLKDTEYNLKILQSKNNKRDIRNIRRKIIELLYNEGYTISQIAKIFKRDHSSITRTYLNK